MPNFKSVAPDSIFNPTLNNHKKTKKSSEKLVDDIARCLGLAEQSACRMHTSDSQVCQPDATFLIIKMIGKVLGSSR